MVSLVSPRSWRPKSSKRRTPKRSSLFSNGKIVLVLLNDVLDLSKIEAGKLEIMTAPGDVAQTIGGTVQLFRAQAEGKGLRSCSMRLPKLPPMRHDPDRGPADRLQPHL